ncbi:MAG TPA: hypothetical protein VLF60_05665 [Candidatus Saccharimonadales bacterium]|nr:hypothetical protein [Candidatus Saccharimonadales bacterium]
MSFLKSLFGQQPATATQVRSVLDMVALTASLASNPTEIDPLLDKMRAITANLAPGQAPSPRDTEALLAIYLQLEQYMTTKEPLRTFTKEELRSRLTLELRQQLETFETNSKRGA